MKEDHGKNWNKSLKSMGFIILVFLMGILVGKNLQVELQERAAQDAQMQYDNKVENERVEEEMKAQEIEGLLAADDVFTVSSQEIVVVGDDAASTNETEASLYKPIWNDDYVDLKEKKSIEERLVIRTSFEETLLMNEEDREIIEKTALDFSNMKITCLGDSITEGVNGTVSYPDYLQQILGAKEVVNAGVGGSTIAEYNGVEPMVIRMEDIPADTDLLIVMGGVNDNFHQHEWLFGLLYQDTKGEGTFCGDLELLMRRCGWFFPDMKVIFFTPTSNQQVTEMIAANERLSPQSSYAEAYRVIGMNEGYEVVDLYNLNFMNSHDESIRTNYMVDLTHFNTLGNQILAERIASEILVRYTQ